MKNPTRYRLSIARTFPAHHPRKGEETGFSKAITTALYDNRGLWSVPHKIHTLRKNYDLWAERFKKIDAGEAVLELYEWTGKPYKSTTRTLCQLGRDDGIGLQKIQIERTGHLGRLIPIILKGNKIRSIDGMSLLENDGLNVKDFIDWFELKPGEITEPLAIIQFTKFRY